MTGPAVEVFEGVGPWDPPADGPEIADAHLRRVRQPPGGAPSTVEGVDVEECGLCGHLMGDDRAVAVVEERRAARERGLDPDVYPLVLALERVPTFHVETPPRAKRAAATTPTCSCASTPRGSPDLERLLTTLEMANHVTKRRWVVECALQRGLVFILRPRFSAEARGRAITPDDMRESRGDLGVLAEVFAKNVSASWWRERRPPPPKGARR